MSTIFDHPGGELPTPQHDQKYEAGGDPASRMEQPDELDGADLPGLDDDAHWDAFLADDDEIDPLPAPGDFWIEPS